MPIEIKPWTLPTHESMEGRFIRLEPIDIPKHIDDICAIRIHGSDVEERYRYLYDYPPKTKEEVEAYIKKVSTYMYVMIDKESNKAVGNINLFAAERDHGTIEIGLYFSDLIARKRGATEGIYLVLKHVFDDLKYRRLEWSADNRQETSKQAALRYGFVHETTFKKNEFCKGDVIDNAWYSMIDKDWPIVKISFEKWLDDENFDENGVQKQRLAEIRKNLELEYNAPLKYVDPPPPVISAEESETYAKSIDLTKWTPRKRPARIAFEGQYVKLEPISMEKHGDAFYELIRDEPERYRWLPDNPPKDRKEFQTWLEMAYKSEDPLYFVLVDKASGKIAGRQSYLRIENNFGTIEVGAILWTSLVAKKPAATEAIYLFAKYIFDELGYRRFEWKCNNQNNASKNAALRFGFQYEGVFRNHWVVKGENRDTAWFGMLDTEWPVCKQAFEQWLEPSNFDHDGQQIQKLVDIRNKIIQKI